MSKWVRIENGIVTGHLVAAADQTANGYQETAHDESVFGHRHLGDDLFEPADAQAPTLSITLDSEVIAANAQSNAVVEVRDTGGTLVPITAAYYVPVIRSTDGLQVRLITVNLVGGQASVAFAIPEPGIYHMRLDLIEPAPQSKLAGNPKMIVTEA